MEFGFKEIVFLVFSLITIGSALIVVFHRNILYAAFSLILTFFGVAALYVFLMADFIAAVQVLIYVGGILVLIVFAVMLSHKVYGVKLKEKKIRLLPAVITSLAMGGLILKLIAQVKWSVIAQRLPSEGTTANLGDLILSDFLLPFEAVSVLLLAALIGAIILARPAR